MLLILVLGVAYWYSTGLGPANIAAIARATGVAGVVVIAAGILFTQVVSFLSTTPLMLLAIQLYGYLKATILLYGISLITMIVNYWIARLYGRSVVRRIVGVRVMQRIDSFSRRDQSKLLVVGRLFGYFFVDVLSYAFGLTRIPFPKYFLYSAVLTAVPTIIEYCLFQKFQFNTLGHGVLYYCYLLCTALVFFVLVRRIYVNSVSGTANADDMKK